VNSGGEKIVICSRKAPTSVFTRGKRMCFFGPLPKFGRISCLWGGRCDCKLGDLGRSSSTLVTGKKSIRIHHLLNKKISEGRGVRAH